MADTYKRYRSAVTGRFITAKDALSRPSRSIGETVKRIVVKVGFKSRSDGAS